MSLLFSVVFSATLWTSLVSFLWFAHPWIDAVVSSKEAQQGLGSCHSSFITAELCASCFGAPGILDTLWHEWFCRGKKWRYLSLGHSGGIWKFPLNISSFQFSVRGFLSWALFRNSLKLPFKCHCSPVLLHFLLTYKHKATSLKQIEHKTFLILPVTFFSFF